MVLKLFNSCAKIEIFFCLALTFALKNSKAQGIINDFNFLWHTFNGYSFFSDTSEIPKLLSLPTQTVISESSPFRLLCYTSAGDKPLFFQWTKNGQLLWNSPQTHYKIENSKDVSEFMIKNVDRNDSGNYSCIARNAFGEDIMHSKLLVKGLKI